jgi:hypothetical protein
MELNWLNYLYLLAPLLIPVNLICAALAHRTAYQRGYLKTGYILGLFFGPPGLLAAQLLPQRDDPVLRLEYELHYETRDNKSLAFGFSSVIALAALVWSCAVLVSVLRVQMGDPTFEEPEALTGDLHWNALVTGCVLAICYWLLATRAQPPLTMLPALPEHSTQGMEELLSWVSLRHALALAKHRAGLLTYWRQISERMILGGVLVAIFYWFKQDLPPWAKYAVCVVPVLGVIMRVVLSQPQDLAAARKLQLERVIEQQYGLVGPAAQFGPRALYADSPEQMLLHYQHIDAKSLEIRRSGKGEVGNPEQARSIALATLDASTSTRRLALLKPLAAAGALALVTKGCLAIEHATRFTHLAKDSYEGANAQHQLGYFFLACGLFVLLYLAWSLLARRRS